MGANASGVVWPDELVARLAEHHRVIAYDHRDTGRSTWAFGDRPSAIRDLAVDALTVLDALGVDRAHVVGMSMGGVLVQLLLADHPERLRSATMFCTAALGSGLAAGDDADDDLPGPDPRLLEMWAEMGEPREPEAELAWRVAHWRVLNGDELPFDPEVWQRLEQRVIEHSGRLEGPSDPQRAEHRDPHPHRRPGFLTLVRRAQADKLAWEPQPPYRAGSTGDGHARSRGPCVVTIFGLALRLWSAGKSGRRTSFTDPRSRS